MEMWEKEYSQLKPMTKPKMKEERDLEIFWNTWRPPTGNRIEDANRMETMDAEKPTIVQNMRKMFKKDDKLI